MPRAPNIRLSLDVAGVKHANLLAIRIVHLAKKNHGDILRNPVVDEFVLRAPGSDRRGFHLIGFVSINDFVVAKQPVIKIVQYVFTHIFVREVAADKSPGAILGSHAADAVSRRSIQELPVVSRLWWLIDSKRNATNLLRDRVNTTSVLLSPGDPMRR